MKYNGLLLSALALGCEGLSFGFPWREQVPLVGPIWDRIQGDTKASELVDQAADFFEVPLNDIPASVSEAWKGLEVNMVKN